MQLASSSTSLATLFCVLYASTVWGIDCYTPSGGTAYSDQNSWLDWSPPELKKCPDSDTCCWVAQTCLEGKRLCSDKRGLLRGYCTRKNWNEPGAECSPLCLNQGEGRDGAAILQQCPDKTYCCDDISDSGWELVSKCCDGKRGFSIDEYVYDNKPTNDSKPVSTKTSSSKSTQKPTSTRNSASQTPTETPPSEPKERKSKGLATGEKAGIGVGVTVLVAAATLGTYYAKRRRRNKIFAAYPADESMHRLDATSAVHAPSELPGDSPWGRQISCPPGV